MAAAVWRVFGNNVFQTVFNAVNEILVPMCPGKANQRCATCAPFDPAKHLRAAALSVNKQVRCRPSAADIESLAQHLETVVAELSESQQQVIGGLFSYDSSYNDWPVARTACVRNAMAPTFVYDLEQPSLRPVLDRLTTHNDTTIDWDVENGMWSENPFAYLVTYCLLDEAITRIPRLCAEATAWNATTSYPIGALVLRDGRVYESTEENNVDSDPAVSVGGWRLLVTCPAERRAATQPMTQGVDRCPSGRGVQIRMGDRTTVIVCAP